MGCHLVRTGIHVGIWGKTVLEVGKACAKVLRQEHACDVQGRPKRQTWLGQSG